MFVDASGVSGAQTRVGAKRSAGSQRDPSETASCVLDTPTTSSSGPGSNLTTPATSDVSGPTRTAGRPRADRPEDLRRRGVLGDPRRDSPQRCLLQRESAQIVVRLGLRDRGGDQLGEGGEARLGLSRRGRGEHDPAAVAASECGQRVAPMSLADGDHPPDAALDDDRHPDSEPQSAGARSGGDRPRELRVVDLRRLSVVNTVALRLGPWSGQRLPTGKPGSLNDATTTDDAPDSNRTMLTADASRIRATSCATDEKTSMGAAPSATSVATLRSAACSARTRRRPRATRTWRSRSPRAR